ncbi:MAG: C40 family peptidase [Gammaproteobacteria bacterium]|nr:C40 family peptidase [Gammaproteobacteria bacterium]MBU1625075.1 C40 family peptidase [Gammaproteobacteria bacterium]MBU1981335.1 C40 family peptidase [Gammaproteobacteria bacterium]
MHKISLLLLIALLTACGSAPVRQDSASNERMNDLVMYAISLAETPYQYGGSSTRSGFDCSGYVGHVYREVLDINLPRTTKALSGVGDPLSQRELRPGDLVFFNTQRRPFSHVGIYVGERKFVHSPKTGSRIRVENMELNYWKSRYNGARRVY